MGQQITSPLLLTLLLKFYSCFSFHLAAMQLFISIGEKSYEDKYHFPPHVPVITENILIAIIRFARYYLQVASNSTFMTDFL